MIGVPIAYVASFLPIVLALKHGVLRYEVWYKIQSSYTAPQDCAHEYGNQPVKDAIARYVMFLEHL